MAGLTFGVTGANGFAGSRIAALLAKHGEMREITRHQPYRFVLGEPIDPQILAGVDVLVHCAWDFRARSWREVQRVNVAGSLALFDAAREANVGRVIFISSMTAFEGTKSKYGRAKLAVERRAAQHHPAVAIVRPGLLYEAQGAGIFGAMQRVVAKAPVVPLIAGGQEFYTCHTEDLARAVLELAMGPLPDAPVVAAEPVARTLRDILATTAAAAGRSPRFVPVPYQAAYWGLRLLEALHVPTRLRSDSIIGLVNNDPAPRFGGLQTTFRAFSVAAVRGTDAG